MKNSPLPWRNVGGAQAASANGMFAASAIISPDALTGAREADERIDMIVRSVNALPDLVNALEEIVKHMESNGMGDWPVAKKARAAIAKVKQP